MNQTRAKALELAIIYAAGHPLDNEQSLLHLAEIFRGYLEEPTEPVPEPDYPRIQVPE